MVVIVVTALVVPLPVVVVIAAAASITPITVMAAVVVVVVVVVAATLLDAPQYYRNRHQVHATASEHKHYSNWRISSSTPIYVVGARAWVHCHRGHLIWGNW